MKHIGWEFSRIIRITDDYYFIIKVVVNNVNNVNNVTGKVNVGILYM